MSEAEMDNLQKVYFCNFVRSVLSNWQGRLEDDDNMIGRSLYY